MTTAATAVQFCRNKHVRTVYPAQQLCNFKESFCSASLRTKRVYTIVTLLRRGLTATCSRRMLRGSEGDGAARGPTLSLELNGPRQIFQSRKRLKLSSEQTGSQPWIIDDGSMFGESYLTHVLAAEFPWTPGVQLHVSAATRPSLHEIPTSTRADLSPMVRELVLLFRLTCKCSLRSSRIQVPTLYLCPLLNQT